MVNFVENPTLYRLHRFLEAPIIQLWMNAIYETFTHFLLKSVQSEKKKIQITYENSSAFPIYFFLTFFHPGWGKKACRNKETMKWNKKQTNKICKYYKQGAKYLLVILR